MFKFNESMFESNESMIEINESMIEINESMRLKLKTLVFESLMVVNLPY